MDRQPEGWTDGWIDEWIGGWLGGWHGWKIPFPQLALVQTVEV